MTESAKPTELETAILALYRGPLEEFVARRDALVKQLRATKDRDEAALVKALRKPSRMAWVLDSIVHEDPAAVARLDAALAQAHSATDLRTAFDTVKTAVRHVAAIGARVAVRAGQPVEPSAVVAALYAVIGDAAALSTFRAGQLVEVPEGGGLDMLSAGVRDEPLPTTPSSPEPRSTKAPSSKDDSNTAKQDAVDAKIEAEAAKKRADLAKLARAEVQRAEALLAQVKERSERAAKGELDARTQLEAAERAALQARSEAEARRADLERAAEATEVAAAALQHAERAVAHARARLGEATE